jgi:parvulin-like peptidyl-prolyl isomerase
VILLRQAILLLIGVLLLAACGGGAAPEQTVVPPAAETQNTENNSTNADNTQNVQNPAGQSAQDAVALVNGQPISRAVFDREMARRQQVSFDTDPSLLAEAVLQTMIEQQIIAQEAQERSITVTDAEVDAEVNRLFQEVNSQEEWQNWLAANMYTEEEFREAQRELLISNQVREAVSNVSGGEVTQVRARHILVATEVEAQQALQRLQNGADFGALAAEISRDITTRERGGDLGFFVRENLTTPELADVAFSLQPGQIAGPVATALGYHIIETIEFAERTASPEEAQEQIQVQFNAWLDEQLRSASIQRILD